MKSTMMLSLFAISGAVGVAGCSSSSSTPSSNTVTMVQGSQESKTASNAVTLPKNSTTFAFDIDGDGKVDNRLGNIIQAVNSLGLDPQTATTTSVTSGSLLFLFTETSTDSTQQSATDAGVTLTLANKPATAPKYDGTDTFTVNTATSAANFLGNISAGTFTSNDPATATASNMVSLTVGLSLAAGQPAINLPVIGGYLTFTADATGKITSGQVNGAVKKTDVDSVIIPEVATLLTAQIQAAGCVPGTGPSGALAMFDPNKDCMVTAAEVSGNAIIGNFLSPDVQMFQAGVYGPVPGSAQADKDSLSLGIGFTSVKASF